MRRHWIVAPMMAATLLAGPAGCGGDAKQGPDAPAEGSAIPLQSIHSTNGQKGLRRVTIAEGQPHSADLDRIRTQFRGSSNVFLVRGKDIAAAVKSTARVLVEGCSADAPAAPGEASEGSPLWMVGFLGITGSAPPALLVQSVVRKGNAIRLSVSVAKRGGRTEDSHHYLVWVPLGELKAGAYTLELFDADGNEVTVMRRVRVTKK